MKTWKMGLICQGKNQNVKYVIRLKSPLHERSIRQRDVNATLQVTDGQRFVSPIAKRVHKGYKFCTDVLRGCFVWSIQLKVLVRYIAAPIAILPSSRHNKNSCLVILGWILKKNSGIFLGSDWCALGRDWYAGAYAPAYQTVIYTEWHKPGVALIQ